MTGLSGVTAATPPTSTDFPNPLDTNMLAWVPQVLNGGTKVVWTNSSGGSGNFGSVKTVAGFTITAASAFNGTASFATNGFQQDSGGPNLDISGTVAGPVSAASPVTPPAAGAPAATTLTLVIIGLGLALAGSYAARSRRGQLSE